MQVKYRCVLFSNVPLTCKPADVMRSCQQLHNEILYRMLGMTRVVVYIHTQKLAYKWNLYKMKVFFY